MMMSPEEITKIIEKAVDKAVKEAVHNELGQYKVPKEQHYNDHIWLESMRKWQENVKSQITKTVIGILISALFALLVYGFILFGKKTIGT